MFPSLSDSMRSSGNTYICYYAVWQQNTYYIYMHGAYTHLQTDTKSKKSLRKYLPITRHVCSA